MTERPAELGHWEFSGCEIIPVSSCTPSYNEAGCFCDGSGDVRCTVCGGAGEVGESDGDGTVDTWVSACPECRGRGFLVCPAHEGD